MIIGAALAVVFGGGAFSAFNDTEDITGAATAAIVDFELSSVNDGNTGANEAAGDETLALDFNDEDCDFDYFAPGDSCTITVTVLRATPYAQQLAVDLTTSTPVLVSTPVGSLVCANTNWTAVVNNWKDTFDNGAGVANEDADYFPAGVQDEATFDVVVTLLGSAGNGCQGASLGVSLTVTSTTTGTPHAGAASDDLTP